MRREELWAFWQQRALAPGLPNTQSLEPCAVAEEFEQFLERELFEPLGSDPTLGKITQAKYLLQEWYHERRYLDAAQHPGEQRTCVYTVYEKAYDRLHLMKLRLRPAPNLILEYEERSQPPAPAPSPSPSIPAPSPRAVGSIAFEVDEFDEDGDATEVLSD